MKLAFFVSELTLILALEKKLNNWFGHSVFQKICLGILLGFCVCTGFCILNNGNIL